MKCLVVDHSATMRRALANAVRNAGGKAVEAADGQEALELCNRDIFAVLTAWNMPVMTGLELVRRLRENPETAHIRVMMVTTRNHRQDVLEAMQAGVNNYLLKPFTPDALRGKVEELLHPPATEERAAA